MHTDDLPSKSNIKILRNIWQSPSMYETIHIALHGVGDFSHSCIKSCSGNRFDADLPDKSLSRKSNTFSVTFFFFLLPFWSYPCFTTSLIYLKAPHTDCRGVYIDRVLIIWNFFTNLTGGSFSQLIQWTLQSLNILNQLGNLEIWKKRFCM